jgi:hypothetical protein
MYCTVVLIIILLFIVSCTDNRISNEPIWKIRLLDKAVAVVVSSNMEGVGGSVVYLLVHLSTSLPGGNPGRSGIVAPERILRVETASDPGCSAKE